MKLVVIKILPILLFFNSIYVFANEDVFCPKSLYCITGSCYDSDGPGNYNYFTQSPNNQLSGNFSFYVAETGGSNGSSCSYTDASSKTTNQVILKSIVTLYPHQNQYWELAGSGQYRCYNNAANCVFYKK